MFEHRPSHKDLERPVGNIRWHSGDRRGMESDQFSVTRKNLRNVNCRFQNLNGQYIGRRYTLLRQRMDDSKCWGMQVSFGWGSDGTNCHARASLGVTLAIWLDIRSSVWTFLNPRNIVPRHIKRMHRQPTTVESKAEVLWANNFYKSNKAKQLFLHFRW